MKKKKVSSMLYEIADLLELKNEEFKPRAYRRAARNVEALSEDIMKMHDEGRLQDIEGVGEGIAGKIADFLDEGKSPYLEDLKEELPKGLEEMMDVPGLGPKTVMKIYNELGVSDISSLKEAAQEGEIRELEGMGEKSERNILEGIVTLEKVGGRFLMSETHPVSMDIVRFLKQEGPVIDVAVAGSLRRMKETIGDIDIIATSDSPNKVMDAFTSHENVAKVILKGDKKTSIRLESGVQVDLRVVEKDQFGSALQYFTGSKDHNVKLRQRAMGMELKVNEYGVFRKKTDERIAGETERGMYEVLEMAFVPPEMREDRGEVEKAVEGALPELVTRDDIRGDLQVHTDWTDGVDTLEAMVDKAVEMGYAFIGITDHSVSLKVANGLDAQRLEEQHSVVRNLNDERDDIELFHGIEADILEDGTLDMPDEELDKLDYVVGAIHSKFNLDKREMTERLITAFENYNMKMLAHPTTRLIGKRDPISLDMEKVFQKARDENVVLEINASPRRLDLSDENCRKAIEAGVLLAINTDAHSTVQLENMRYGVGTARRGWAGKNDVLNTKTTEEVREMLGG